LAQHSSLTSQFGVVEVQEYCKGAGSGKTFLLDKKIILEMRSKNYISQLFQQFSFESTDSSKQGQNMSKRSAEDHENGGVSLKGGERPEQPDLDDEVGEFEDEFEDEYESEDEILEAGVDGRPDAEREAEEKAGE